MHLAIPKNENGRDFVVGDIHGCYDLLMATLTEVGFNKQQDRLFSVGDIIDRGPDSHKCLTLLNESWFYMVLGNHEQMMIDFISRGEGYNWIKTFGGWARSLRTSDLNEYVKKLTKCPISITLAGGPYSVGICHAEPDGNDWIKMRDNPSSITTMMWGRKVLSGKVDFDVEGVDVTIHGHTPMDSPKWVGNRYFLDTGASDNGKLTVRNIAEIYSEFMLTRTVFKT